VPKDTGKSFTYIMEIEKGLGKHYLYRHIRLDKNEPFYIGIGTKTKAVHRSERHEYYRAYKTIGRNPIWKKIVEKTEYEVEILFESEDYEFIKQKEIEFIALYGRSYNKTGILCNLTDGGDGILGYVHTKESSTRGAEKRRGIKLTEETRQKMRDNSYQRGRFGIDAVHPKKYYQYDKNGNFIKEWDSGADLCRDLNMTIASIRRCCNGLQRYSQGFLWRHEFLGLKIDPGPPIDNRIKSVELYDNNTGETIEKFLRIVDAAEKYYGDKNKSTTGIVRTCQNVYKNYKGLNWRYSDDNL
jgi:hypothetical protein